MVVLIVAAMVLGPSLTRAAEPTQRVVRVGFIDTYLPSSTVSGRLHSGRACIR